MFEFIDLIIGPLTELHPVRYATDPTYRAQKEFQLGKRAKRVFFYQLFICFLLVFTSLAVGSMLLW